MARVLVLFAHPALEKSRVHRRMARVAAQVEGITFHDLYERYPDFTINIEREQQLLLEHDQIVMQFPLYWYSTPALLKQWCDLVLQHGWAYGSKGTALRGKRLLCATSAGGAEDAYHEGGYNRFTIRQFLAPMEQTAFLCKMDYLPPYLLFGVHRLTGADIDRAAERYAPLLAALRDDALDLAALNYDAITLNSFAETTLAEVRR